MLKKSKILVLIATVLCGVIFVTFMSLGIAELCSYNPVGKTYKASQVITETDKDNKTTLYFKLTFYSDTYELESRLIAFVDGERTVNESEIERGGFKVSGNKIIISDSDEMEINGRTIICQGLTFKRSGYWLTGIYWGVGFTALFAGAGALCFYKYYVYKKTKTGGSVQDEE